MTADRLPVVGDTVRSHYRKRWKGVILEVVRDIPYEGNSSGVSKSNYNRFYKFGINRIVLVKPTESVDGRKIKCKPRHLSCFWLEIL